MARALLALVLAVGRLLAAALLLAGALSTAAPLAAQAHASQPLHGRQSAHDRQQTQDAAARRAAAPTGSGAISTGPSPAVVALIDECIARLDSALDVGYPRIAARCPELTPALNDSPWAAWLPADWKGPDNRLSAGSLAELSTLIARESAFSTMRRLPPRTTRIAEVYAGIARSEGGSVGWWRRFKDWLRGVFSAPPRAGESWLRRLLSEVDLSTRTSELIAWGAFALVVALAAAVVISELRAAGLLAAGAASVRTQARPPNSRTAPTLEAIAHAAAEEQPALLLELIAATLTEQQRLPMSRALTVRELGWRAQLPQESSRSQLLELIGVCERVRFSGQAVGSAMLDFALRGGRRLLETLDGPPPRQRAMEVH